MPAKRPPKNKNKPKQEKCVSEAFQRFYGSMQKLSHEGALTQDILESLLRGYRAQMDLGERLLADAYIAYYGDQKEWAAQVASRVAAGKWPVGDHAHDFLGSIRERIAPTTEGFFAGGRFNYEAAAANARHAQQLRKEKLAPSNFWLAIDHAYPPGFWETYAHVKKNESNDFDPLVEFLDADPYFFRTGYIKGYLLTILKRRSEELSPAQRARLENVVLAAIKREPRREYPYYLRLARRLRSDRLLEGIRGLMDSQDERVKTWAEEALEYIMRP